MDDETLTARLAHDLDGTFEALVLAHQDRLYTIALRLLGDPRDAEEVAQDGFVRAYQALQTYAPPRIRDLRLRPWLATIVVNLARNKRRRLADRVALIDLASLAAAGAEPAAERSVQPDVGALQRSTAERWAGHLLGLPPVYRAPVILRHVDGMSVEEVCEALGRPEGTVKSQVHRGLAMLRAALEAEMPAEREEMTA
jgi:RNA polymerase sigma factor (sigma-70 family)